MWTSFGYIVLDRLYLLYSKRMEREGEGIKEREGGRGGESEGKEGGGREGEIRVWRKKG